MMNIFIVLLKEDIIQLKNKYVNWKTRLTIKRKGKLKEKNKKREAIKSKLKYMENTSQNDNIQTSEVLPYKGPYWKQFCQKAQIK